MRKSIYKMVPLIVLFALLLCGCGESENSGGSTLPFPNYGTVLEQNEETSAYAWAGEESTNTRPSKNLIPYNNVSQLFEGTLPTQIAAFQYRKAEGVPEKMGKH